MGPSCTDPRSPDTQYVHSIFFLGTNVCQLDESGLSLVDSLVKTFEENQIL